MIFITPTYDSHHGIGYTLAVTCIRIKTDAFMKIILLLVLISLIVALGFLMAFFWAVKAGQYEDDYSPSVRILFEQESTKKDPSNS